VAAAKPAITKPALRTGQRTRPARHRAAAPPALAPHAAAQKRKPYDKDLPRVAANFQPLTPLTMLERAASVFSRSCCGHSRQGASVLRRFLSRCRKLASALAGKGIKKGDTVAAMLANTPAMLEAHQAVPMTGAVLNALNTRLDAASIAYMLDHGGAKILIADREFPPP